MAAASERISERYASPFGATLTSATVTWLGMNPLVCSGGAAVLSVSRPIGRSDKVAARCYHCCLSLSGATFAARNAIDLMCLSAAAAAQIETERRAQCRHIYLLKKVRFRSNDKREGRAAMHRTRVECTRAQTQQRRPRRKNKSNFSPAGSRRAAQVYLAARVA